MLLVNNDPLRLLQQSGRGKATRDGLSDGPLPTCLIKVTSNNVNNVGEDLLMFVYNVR